MVVLTLGVGIGATTAIFSVVDAVLLSALPYPGADRLVMVWVTNPEQDIARDVTSFPTFRDWEEQARSFDALAARATATFTITGTGDPFLVPGARVSGRYFDLFGVPAAVGRTLQPADTEPGRHEVVVLGHDVWRDRFAASNGVIGTRIEVNGRPFEVIGVMPQGFTPTGEERMWTPLAAAPPLTNLMDARGALWLDVLGRLSRDVDIEQTESEMAAIMRRLDTEYPGSYTGQGIDLEPLQETLVGDTRPTLLLLGGAVAMVLLVGCANVAGLLVARLSSRRREFAVRVAIGAGRADLLRQLLLESALLGLAGAAAGLLFAGWGLDALLTARPDNLPRAGEIALNWRAVCFACLAGVGAALTFGLIPALGLLGREPQADLKEDARGSVGTAGQLLRRGLVVAEIAVACVLLTGAGLLLRSFAATQAVDPGIERERLFTMQVNLPSARYPQPSDWIAFYSRFIDGLEASPDVERAGAMGSLMLSRLPNSATLRVEGAAPPPPGTPNEPVTFDSVMPGTFDALGVALMRGRAFTTADTDRSQAVAMVNDAFVRRFFPGGADPIGRRVTFSGFNSQNPQWLTITGVVADTRRNGLRAQPRAELYAPFAQAPDSSLYVVLKSRTTADGVAPTARAVMRSLDPQLPIAEPLTMNAVLSQSVAEDRFRMALVVGFAVTALLLAALGVYGLMSYTTLQRMREFGVRMALGASRGQVLRSVMRDALALAGAGLAIGLAGSGLAARSIAGLLYGVEPFDPVTFTMMAGVLILCALGASFFPARRATRVDPMTALRN